MDRRLVAFAAGAILLAGCNSKEEQLQQRLAESEQKQKEMQQFVTDRDSYLVEVINSVNAVYADLEQARLREGKLLNRTENTGQTETTASLDTRRKLLADIGEIGTALKENRKRIAALEARARESGRRIAALDTLITSLKRTLVEREQSIAMLEGKVMGLEATVAESRKQIAERDSVIGIQQERMNTAYYVIGKREELEQKGIITDEGGFPWGLFGSTTVLGSGLDSLDFLSLDKAKDQLIRVPGKIDEIVPRRQETFYAMAQQDDEHSNLMIKNPEKFWQDRYLVIILD